jgi:hypothetical protein
MKLKMPVMQLIPTRVAVSTSCFTVLKQTSRVDAKQALVTGVAHEEADVYASLDAILEIQRPSIFHVTEDATL